jgi:hypothetical protein
MTKTKQLLLTELKFHKANNPLVLEASDSTVDGSKRRV